MYIKFNPDSDILIVCLYVNDLIYTGNNPKVISKFKEAMISHFAMIDLGLISYFLGIEVSQTNHGIFITQKKYAGDILKSFKMDTAKSMLTSAEEKLKLVKDRGGEFVDATNFRRLVGSLRHLTSTKSNINFGVGLIGRLMESPRQSYWQAAKRILRYIRGTQSDGIFYPYANNSSLVGFTDSD